MSSFFFLFEISGFFDKKEKEKKTQKSFLTFFF